MAEHTAGQSDTIEWGATVAERQGWLGKLTAAAPPEESAGPARRRLRVNYIALGFAVAGFIGMLASQYLPWMTLDLPAGVVGGGDQRNAELPFGSINTWQVIAYSLTLPLVFAAIAGLLVAGDALRVPLAAVAIGLMVGQVTILVGIARLIEDGASWAGLSGADSVADFASIGSGFTIAVVATVLLIVASVVGARAPRARRSKDEAAEVAEEQPLDLVVGPLPESAYRGDIHSDPASTHG